MTRRRHSTEAPNAFSDAALAARIRELRESLGLTQGELAVRVGTTRNMVSHWETMFRRIGLQNLVRVVQGTGANVEWLVFGTGPMLKRAASEIPHT